MVRVTNLNINETMLMILNMVNSNTGILMVNFDTSSTTWVGGNMVYKNISARVDNMCLRECIIWVILSKTLLLESMSYTWYFNCHSGQYKYTNITSLTRNNLRSIHMWIYKHNYKFNL